MMTKLNSLALALGAMALATQAQAFSAVSGNDNGGTSNVLRNACGLPAGTATGTTVEGCLQSGEDVFVSSIDKAGAESLIISGGGQASIEPALDNNPFSAFSVSFVTDGQFISKAVVNLSASNDGFVQFSDGVNTSSLLAISRNGSNFFTITGDAYDTLSVRAYTDAAGTTETDLIGSIAQIRLGITTQVPEPESYAMMVGGLAILGFMGRRRRAAKAA